MQKRINKLALFLHVMAVPFALSAQDSSEPNGLVSMAPRKPFFGQTNLATTRSSSNDSSEQITPPAGPTVQDRGDLFITADFIYWKASVTGLNYAYTGGVSGGGFTSLTNANKGHMKSPDFTYEPGFKVGLGILCAHDNWDIYAEYTWLNVPGGATQSSLHGNSTDIVQGVNTWGYLGISPVYGNVSSTWSLSFNVLDFEIGREFWISKRLSLRPHLGLKFSWQDQDYVIKGSNVILNGVVTTGILTYKNSLDQFGVGIRSGLDSSYFLFNKWAIFGDLAISGMWNYFDTVRKDFYQSAPDAPIYTNSNVHQRPNSLTAIVELDLGLRFETIFCQGRYKYLLQAGWETQVWFEQEQFTRFTLHTPGTLSFQGLTIKTGFWF